MNIYAELVRNHKNYGIKSLQDNNLTNALLHPAALNAQSGSAIQYATAAAGGAIVMPKIIVTPAIAVPDGTTEQESENMRSVEINEYTAGTIRVIGIYGNGANDKPIDPEDIVSMVRSSGGTTKIVLPAKTLDGPTQYLIKFERNVTSGAMLKNTTSVSSDLVKLTLFCAMGDPCEDSLRPCYVVIPRFAADPSMTISLDAETQEVDFSGNLNVD